jgi:hypothetical protein
MKPVPIGDEETLPGMDRFVLMSPFAEESGDFTTVECLIDSQFDDVPSVLVLMELDEGDLERLVLNGGKFWYKTKGLPMRPFEMIPAYGDGEP